MNLINLNKRFNTERKCIKYLEETRFKDGIYCLHCRSNKVYKRKNDTRWHCNTCKKDFSVLYGTIFENSKLPLPKWFTVIALMVNSKSGISAKEIQRNIGGSYKTSWYSAMRARCAMIETPELIEGIVEMDEAYIGGKPRTKPAPSNQAVLSIVEPKTPTNKRGRGTNKVPVVGLVSRGKSGRVVTEVSQKLGQKQLLNVLKKNVNTKESVLITDDFRAYQNFENHIEHIRTQHKAKNKGVNHTNTIEGFWSIIKNGIKGNYKAVSKKYLPFYLTEYAHKYNARNKDNDFELTIEKASDNDKCLIEFKPKKEVEKIVYNKLPNPPKPELTKPLNQKKKAKSKPKTKTKGTKKLTTNKTNIKPKAVKKATTKTNEKTIKVNTITIRQINNTKPKLRKTYTRKNRVAVK